MSETMNAGTTPTSNVVVYPMGVVDSAGKIQLAGGAPDYLNIAGVQKQIKYAAISASTSGDGNTIVAAVASKKIRVLGYLLSSSGTVNVKWSSDPAGTPAYLTGLQYCVAASGVSMPYCPAGWFETVSGKALGMNLSGAVAVGGFLIYVEV